MRAPSGLVDWFLVALDVGIGWTLGQQAAWALIGLVRRMGKR